MTARALPSFLATALLCAALLTGGPALASESHAAPPARAGTNYLALGDSVPFGYRELATTPTPDYRDATSFVGFPEDVAGDLHLRLANAACPGETSTSLITGTAPSNGCEGIPGSPGYRDAFPLHVAYSGSQLDFAVDYLRAHRRTRLVTLMVGANDGFLCQRNTPDHCVAELPAVLQTVAANVATILGRIRYEAHYVGQVVLVNYYSLDYGDPTQNALSAGLNQVLDAAAAPFHVAIADGFGAFQAVAAQAGGDTCAAGLLTVLTTGGCGIHPSATGQDVLADAVEAVVRAG
jgi:lysophospholipase L1-like esterase